MSIKSIRTFIQKIIVFIKYLIHPNDDDIPEKPQPDPQPTPTPTPTPDPKPEPTPTPAPKPLFVSGCVNEKKVVIWNEQSPAADYSMGGDVMARSGNIKGRTWRLLHGLYDAMPKDINSVVKAAKNEGCKGIVLDVEGDFNTANNLRAVKKACNNFGVKLVGAPKVTANPGGSMPCKNFAETVKLFEEVFDAVMIWGYGCNGDAYEYHMKQWRDCGYTKQIGVFQDQVRDSGGYMGKQYWRDVATHAKKNGYPFVLLLPNHSSASDLSELRKIFQ